MKVEVVPFVYDFHKKPVHTSIKNYVNVTARIQCDLMDHFARIGATGLVTAGDFYDRGFVKQTDATISAVLLDAEMRSSLDWWDGVIGNHMYLGKNSNPELHISQPNSIIPSKHTHRTGLVKLDLKHRILNNTVQISYMHFRVTDKPQDYIAKRQPGIKHHIAVYHTDHAFPNMSSPDVLDMLFKDVDVAIVGHQHKNFGILTHGHTQIFAFGATNNTSNDINTLKPHATVPILTVELDGTWSWAYHKQSLYLGEAGITAKDPNTAEAKQDKLVIKSLKNVVVSFESFNGDGAKMETKIFEGVLPYLHSTGYSEKEINHMLSIIEKPNNITYHIGKLKGSN